MHSSEPGGRQEGDRPELRKNFSVKLTLRQRYLLDREASRRGCSKQSILLQQLAAFFADLEYRERRDPPAEN